MWDPRWVWSLWEEQRTTLLGSAEERVATSQPEPNFFTAFHPESSRMPDRHRNNWQQSCRVSRNHIVRAESWGHRLRRKSTSLRRDQVGQNMDSFCFDVPRKNLSNSFANLGKRFIVIVLQSIKTNKQLHQTRLVHLRQLRLRAPEPVKPVWQVFQLTQKNGQEISQF